MSKSNVKINNYFSNFCLVEGEARDESPALVSLEDTCISLILRIWQGQTNIVVAGVQQIILDKTTCMASKHISPTLWSFN